MITDEIIPLRIDVPWRNIDGNIIVVKPMEGVLYPLNSVATQIWLLSDGTKRVADIIEILLAEFDGEADAIRKDTFLFLEELANASLIKIGKAEETVPLKKES